MKKTNWICVALILVCLGILLGYRLLDRARTDTTPPEIRISQENLTLSVEDPEELLLQGVSASDKRDGDVTKSLVVERISLVAPDGTLQVRYAAFDRSGNVAKAERTASYTDYESPKFSLNRALVYTEGASVDPLTAIGAQDLLDGDITHLIRATPLDTMSIMYQGTHNVQFRVTNSLGDVSELVLPVEVLPAGSYDAQLTLSKYLIYLNVNDRFRAEDYLGRFVLGRNEVGLSGGLPEGFRLKTSGQVDTTTPGVYTVGYTVTYTGENMGYSLGNQSGVGYSKLIVVVEG